jgi:GntR family transcriptional regulator / MocR family aminotransferase
VPIDEASWLTFDRRSNETLRSALERTLREAILSGALRGGVEVPGSRTLARALGISRGVVSDAYGQLEAQGFLVASPRSAPRVAKGLVALDQPDRAGEPDTAAFRYDFAPTSPDVVRFPVQRWLHAVQRVAKREPFSIFDYGQPKGEPALHVALAEHLGRTRGVIAEPDQIVVVHGTAQAIDLLLRVFRKSGRSRVAVEDPSHTTQQERIRAHGLELVPRAVDVDGLILDGLDADAVLVTPAHQFPTGAVLSGARRRDLLAWARATGGIVIEDDYDSEFRYDREPVRALQGLAPDVVVLVGTVSKTLAPALRLGWVVAPRDLTDEITTMKRLADDFTQTLDQLALAELLTSGSYARHLRDTRAIYAQRRRRLIDALTRELPQLPIEGVAAGMHVMLSLERGTDDRVVSRAAAAAGINVPPLSSFRIKPAEATGLVIGYGRLHEDAIGEAVTALAAIVRQYS